MNLTDDRARIQLVASAIIGVCGVLSLVGSSGTADQRTHPAADVAAIVASASLVAYPFVVLLSLQRPENWVWLLRRALAIGVAAACAIFGVSRFIAARAP